MARGRKGAAPPPADAPGPGSPAVPDDDERAFAEAMRGVRPLERPPPPAPANAPPPRPPALGSRPPTPPATLETVEDWGERRALLAAGADRRLLAELRGSSPEAILDLHGLDAEGASRALRAFVDEAHRNGHRRLLVIHGRGRRSGPAGPVLGACVKETLASPALAGKVLVAASAPPGLGGGGAMLVLLRRRR
jgi:DNA-nicking Smr family endonuclease